MDCTWDSALLDGGEQLPHELLQIIREGTNEQYLEALTRTALDARYTYTLLAQCEDLLAHICASLRSYGSFAASIATLGRIVPSAPFLAPTLSPDGTRIYAGRQFSTPIKVYDLGADAFSDLTGPAFVTSLDPRIEVSRRPRQRNNASVDALAGVSARHARDCCHEDDNFQDPQY